MFKIYMANYGAQMVALSPEDSKKADALLKRGEPIAVFALKVLNASSDFSMISNLSENMEQLAILPSILGGCQPSNSLPSLVRQDKVVVFMELAKEICTKFKLNHDQSRY